MLRHRYVTKHLPLYNGTQNGFQTFTNLMKTNDTDAMRDVACFIYHAMNVRKRLIANLIYINLCKVVVHWAFSHIILINILMGRDIMVAGWPLVSNSIPI